MNEAGKLLYADETHAMRGAAFDVYKVGLLINFGAYPKVSIERFVI